MNCPRSTRLVLSRSCAVLSAAALALTLPGCIIQDIHDRMEETSLEMSRANENLERVTAQLEVANATLEQRLAAIDITNEHLTATRERLELLDAIHHELKALDLHLASLRRTLDNIDSVIPILNLADPATDPAEETPEEPTGTPPDAPATSPTSPQPTPPSSGQPTPAPAQQPAVPPSP